MSNSSQGDTFTLFSFLPKELRVNIWNFALSPRVISFHRDRNRSRFAGTEPIKFMALTTLSPSLEIIPRVCAESFTICQKRYTEWDVWDVRKGVSTTKYDLDHDVVYFSHEFARNIDNVLLREFADQYPTQAKQIKTLALPAVFSLSMISGMEVLKSLRLFEGLKELVIVLGYTIQGPMPTGSDSTISRSMKWGEQTERNEETWKLPDGAQEALERLKQEQWPDWNIPKVSVAKFLDEVLSV